MDLHNKGLHLIVQNIAIAYPIFKVYLHNYTSTYVCRKIFN